MECDARDGPAYPVRSNRYRTISGSACFWVDPEREAVLPIEGHDGQKRRQDIRRNVAAKRRWKKSVVQRRETKPSDVSSAAEDVDGAVLAIARSANPNEPDGELRGPCVFDETSCFVRIDIPAERLCLIGRIDRERTFARRCSTQHRVGSGRPGSQQYRMPNVRRRVGTAECKHCRDGGCGDQYRSGKHRLGEPVTTNERASSRPARIPGRCGRCATSPDEPARRCCRHGSKRTLPQSGSETPGFPAVG